MISDILLLFFVSLLPVIEPRYGVAFGFWRLDLNGWLIIATALFAGVFLVWLLTKLFYDWIDKFRHKWFKRLFVLWEARVLHKHGQRLELFGLLGLIAFVAVPIPLTGVYTGVTLGYLAGLPKRYTFLGALLGMIISTVVVALGWQSVDVSSKFLLELF